MHECVSVHVCLFLPVRWTCRWKGRMLFEFMSTYIFTVCACGKHAHLSIRGSEDELDWILKVRLRKPVGGWLLIMIAVDSDFILQSETCGTSAEPGWLTLRQSGTGWCGTWWERSGKKCHFHLWTSGWSVALIQYITSITVQFLIKARA